MYRYFDPADDSFLRNEETFQRIIEQLNPFISNLNSEEDRQLMLRMLSSCYHKYHNSINVKSGSDIELMLSAVMSLLIEQSNEIERLSLIAKTRQN